METEEEIKERDLNPTGRADMVLPTTSAAPGSTSSGASSSSSTLVKRHRRITRFFTSLPFISRLIRLLRFILGPSTPLPDSSIPHPQPSFTVNLTLPTRSWHFPLDVALLNLSHRFRLHRLLYPFLVLWATAFVLLIRQQYYVAGPEIIGCNAAVWGDWPPDTCGFNGTDCISELYSGTYRCLGGCKDALLGNPRWIGGEEIDLVPVVIGGNDAIYRADSWVCPAAIHAGLISPSLGGCVTLRPLPFFFGRSNFQASKSHGIQSTAFAPSYPGAYGLLDTSQAGCLDLHPIISFFNAICLLITVLFFRPSPALLSMILVTLGWFQLTLVSDPPDQPPDWSKVIGGLPPVLIAAYWAHKVSFKRTLDGFRGLPLDVGVWQGAGFWLGMESSQIFAKIPIQRLGYDGLSTDGIISLVVILVAVVIVVIIQALQMRQYGLLRYYLYRYLPLAPILIILAFIPGYTVRLHHYLYSLVAIPVLSLPNRVSLFGQAFVFALFLDGVGRWGWASILEQTESLIGDAVHGTYLPEMLKNSTAEVISWANIPSNLTDIGYAGVTIMVDDILRDWTNTSSYGIGNLNLKSGIDHFIRLAYVANQTSLDYTDPIVLHANGSFTQLW